MWNHQWTGKDLRSGVLLRVIESITEEGQKENPSFSISSQEKLILSWHPITAQILAPDAFQRKIIWSFVTAGVAVFAKLEYWM